MYAYCIVVLRCVDCFHFTNSVPVTVLKTLIIFVANLSLEDLTSFTVGLNRRSLSLIGWANE